MCQNCNLYEKLGIEPREDEQIFLHADGAVIQENAEEIKQFIKIARNYSDMKKLLKDE